MLRILFLLLISSVASQAATETAVSGAGIAELRAVQTAVQRLLPQVRPAVVAVRIRDGTASGVIVNASGLILTAAHVAEKPGREVRVVLDDGKVVKGTTLGLDKTTDAALIQLQDQKQPWPHVKVSRDVLKTLPGGWCVALGHPGGFDKERGVVLRVGRIIRQTANSLQTDCVLMGGDSGGPLFNLQGEVIGIHSQIWEARDHNMHVSMAPFLRGWDEMKSSQVIQVWTTGSGGYLGAAIDVNAAGLIEVVEVLEGTPAQDAGLLAGDVLEAVDARPMQSVSQIHNAIGARAAGDELKLNIRRGSAARELRVKLGSRPREDGAE